MDTKEQVTELYGRREARVEQNANDFYWAMDNWMHTANSDIYLRFKDGKFEVQQDPDARRVGRHAGRRRPDLPEHERVVGARRLRADAVLHAQPEPLRTRGSYEALRDEDNAVNIVWPVRPNPGTNRAYQFGIDRPDGTLDRSSRRSARRWSTAATGCPAELYGNMFVAEPAANLVSRIVLEDDGTTLRARKAYERGEFLASTDERFRPVCLSNAPDGTLYIVDMYRGVIQQRADITEYLRDHIVARKLEQPNGLGRIYRVVHDTTKRDTERGLAKRPPSAAGRSRCRTRTAGGATRRSGCSSSAATSRSCPSS